MPPNFLRVLMKNVLVKSVVPNVLWVVAAETPSAGAWSIFSSSPIPCLNLEGGEPPNFEIVKSVPQKKGGESLVYSAILQEDFGKRNMPRKRVRRHFYQLIEFERGLIIWMKTARWSTRLAAGQVDRSKCAVGNCWEQRTQECTHARKTGSGATRKTTRREDGMIVRQALVDPTVSRSTIRAEVGVAIVPQTISRHLAEANLNPSALSVHSL
ncbi:uncharacterized protein TNCV_4986241 [Trichonephila clavipes]|nr:uncharacterized protein TNCV_4986241 [Trichonephila clavipes]